MIAILFAAVQITAKIINKRIAQAFKKPRLLTAAKKLIAIVELIFSNYYFFNIHYLAHINFKKVFAINKTGYCQKIMYKKKSYCFFDFK